jgi:hypothetical protein
MRPSLVYLWSPAPDPLSRPNLERLLRHLRRRPELRWIATDMTAGLPADPSPIAAVVRDALDQRARVALRRGERALRHLGVRVEHVRRRHLVEPPASDA